MRRFILPLVVLSGGFSSGSPAQGLPLEFVQRALQQQPGETIRLFPGALPPGLTPLSVPTGARLIGSVAHQMPNTGDQPTSLYYSAPGNVAVVRQELQQRLQRGGWKAVPRPRFGPESQGGFQASASGPIDFLNCYRLDQGQSLQIWLSQAHPTQVALTYTLSKPEDLALMIRAQSNGGPFAELPPLQPPDGVEVQAEGGGSSGADVSQSVRLIAPTSSAGDLLGAYAAQLRAAGWTTFHTVRQAKLAQMTFTVKQQSVDSLGTLTIAQTAPGQYKGLLSLTAAR